MKYKLAERQDSGNVRESILLNRGISDPDHYLNTTDEDIIHYSNLGESIKLACSEFIKSIEEKDGIAILADADFDGVASSSILYQYIVETFNLNPIYYIHNGKQHGLSDKELFPTILEDVKSGKVKLLLIPDSSTNDKDECLKLSRLGCKIIITDHHQKEKDNNSAIIINPQLVSTYENLFASGCLITWKLLKALDDELWVSNADKYIDLVAASIVADGMDLRTFENKRLIEKGLSNVTNKMLQAFIDKQSYSIKGDINPTAIAFYIAPLINSLVRVGTTEEKDLMFRAFCQIDQSFEYEKRGGAIVQETIYERVARLAVNAKSRQDRAIEKGIEIVKQDIEANHRNDNKILFAKATDDLPKEFTGLVSMKLASFYNKPCVLLREGNNQYYSGSLRNFSGSPLTDMKGFLQSLGYVQWMAGHSNACAIGLTKKQLLKTIELSNDKLKNYDFSVIYNVDFALTLEQLDHHLLHDLYEMRFHYGQQLPEALILLQNVHLNSSQIQFLGKDGEKNTWKFNITDSIDAIKFRIGSEDILAKTYLNGTGWGGDDLCLNLICKVSQNEFQGELRWNLIVEDYELV
jgi:single-stranded-DNA-specific exonuclease